MSWFACQHLFSLFAINKIWSSEKLLLPPSQSMWFRWGRIPPAAENREVIQNLPVSIVHFPEVGSGFSLWQSQGKETHSWTSFATSEKEELSFCWAVSVCWPVCSSVATLPLRIHISWGEAGTEGCRTTKYRTQSMNCIIWTTGSS